MPVVAYFAVAGSVLLALLFLADRTLEKDGSPVIVTSQRSGLPETPQHPNAVQILTIAPAPEPDMTSQAVLSAQPKAEPAARGKIHPEARAARAEASPQDFRVTQPPLYGQSYYRSTQPFDRLSIQPVDRFSIKGQ